MTDSLLRKDSKALVLHDAIFLAICVAMALHDRLQMVAECNMSSHQIFLHLFQACSDCTT